MFRRDGHIVEREPDDAASPLPAPPSFGGFVGLTSGNSQLGANSADVWRERGLTPGPREPPNFQ
eukprot:7500022-Pyramimonas_sp.AAC.1